MEGRRERARARACVRACMRARARARARVCVRAFACVRACVRVRVCARVRVYAHGARGGSQAERSAADPSPTPAPPPAPPPAPRAHHDLPTLLSPLRLPLATAFRWKQHRGSHLPLGRDLGKEEGGEGALPAGCLLVGRVLIATLFFYVAKYIQHT